MNDGIFEAGSDEVYRQLIGRAVGQKWSGFDTLLPKAQQGDARIFAMAVWNYVPGHARGGTRPGMIEDPELGQRWYFVPRTYANEKGGNRQALWNGIALARKLDVLMMAFLKDHVTKRASTQYVFEITDVAYEEDGSKLWLRLECEEDAAGTVVGRESLARLQALPRIDPAASEPRPPVLRNELTIDQLELAARVAEGLSSGRLSRAAALQAMSRASIAEGTSQRLLESYGRMRSGHALNARLSFAALNLFIDSIVAAGGSAALARVIRSMRAYLAAYPDLHQATLPQLIAELEEQDREGAAVEAAAAAAKLAGVPSEVLRAIWTRGPQHRAFRKLLERRWRGVCCVHDKACNALLRASHIIPWSVDEGRRADVNNGLLLAAPLDSLFDKGLISFADDGRLVASPDLEADTKQLFGVTNDMRLRWDHLLETDRAVLRRSLLEHRRMFGLPSD